MKADPLWELICSQWALRPPARRGPGVAVVVAGLVLLVGLALALAGQLR